MKEHINERTYKLALIFIISLYWECLNSASLPCHRMRTKFCTWMMVEDEHRQKADENGTYIDRYELVVSVRTHI